MHYNVGSITLRKFMPVTVLLLAKDLLTREAITYMLKARDYLVVSVGTTKDAYSSFDGLPLMRL
jgi:hypothetical protein